MVGCLAWQTAGLVPGEMANWLVVWMVIVLMFVWF